MPVPFAQFNSVDILLLYPPFDTTLRIHGHLLTHHDALVAWVRCHGPSHGDLGVVAGKAVHAGHNTATQRPN